MAEGFEPLRGKLRSLRLQTMWTSLDVQSLFNTYNIRMIFKLMLCVIIYLVFIVVLVVLIVIKVMVCTSHSKTQMFKYVSYRKNRWMNFWVTQMSHGGWRYVYILKWTATTQYEENPFFFLLNIRWFCTLGLNLATSVFPPRINLPLGLILMCERQ